MTTLNDIEKLNYINTRFHQYFDLKINKDFVTTERINLVIPINSLYTISNINEILNKYSDTTIQKEKVVYCTKVIDGDTIWVKDVIDYEEDEQGNKITKTFSSLDDYTREDIILSEPYKVRLTGIDTPEMNSENEEILKQAKIATSFVEKVCLHQFIYLNIDTGQQYGNNEPGQDIYKRTLAVVMVNNKNLNEVLLKENFAKKVELDNTKFDMDDWEDNLSDVSLFNENSEDISILSPYFREDMKNLVFTSPTNTNILYPYEVYKGVIYLKLYPYSSTVRMHILPRTYDCSNTGDVLILTDEDIERRVVTQSENYKIYEEKDNINAYFQENNKDRDRTTITNRDYNKNNWQEDSIGKSKTFADFSYNVSDKTKRLNNLEICTGYRYNNTTPYYALHYTGIKDNTGRPEDRCTLIDANVDRVKTKTHIITQMAFKDDTPENTEDDIIYIKHDPEVYKEVSNFDHIAKIGSLNHKILKYINDILYVEEGRSYAVQEWIDRLKPEGLE